MKRIIYIEDDPDTAQACKDILQDAGYKVDLAHTGREGLKKIKNGKYALALIDIMLPDMSGWDVFQQIKNNGIKVVFLTALDVSLQRQEQLKKEGLSDYITKPFTRKDLLERVGKVLE